MEIKDYLSKSHAQHADTPTVLSDDRSDELKNALEKVGASVQSVDKRSSGVRYDLYDVQLNQHFDFSEKYTELSLALGFTLYYSNRLMVQPALGKPHSFEFRLLRDEHTWHWPGEAEFEAVLAQFSNHQGYLLPVCIGVDEQGRAIFKDLAAAPHLFVAGEAGSGKSVCMFAIVKSLLVLNREKIEIAILDPEIVDCYQFEDEPNLCNNQIITDAASMELFLAEQVAVMNARYAKMEEMGAKSWSEYRQYKPYRIIVVYEVAELFKKSKTAEGDLVQLAQKAAAVGIHLILSTQMPNSEIFSQALRANITARIAMRVYGAEQSGVIIGKAGAEWLHGRGDRLIKWGSDVQFAHGYYI